jgi:DDE superfamily endonuclease/Helix-turn-helix of DDE superfamily endonuclease
MSHTDRLQRCPDAFRRLTGLTPAAFDRLLAELTPRYQAAEDRRQPRPGRQRKPGGGRKHALPLADRLLMLLLYYRTYVRHAFLGFLFGIGDSAGGRHINPLQPLLAGLFRVPERRIELAQEDLRELLFDATERPTRRPQRGQRAYYSGKKRRHTIKTQVVVARRRQRPGPGAKPRRVRIAAVSRAFPGSTHDQKVYDRARVIGPPGVRRAGDTGSVGTGLEVPAKRPPKGRLTARQKAGNRRRARRRVVAEQGIGKMKVWRIAWERYRNPVRRHTLILKNVAGLHNLMFSGAELGAGEVRLQILAPYGAVTLLSPTRMRRITR